MSPCVYRWVLHIAQAHAESPAYLHGNSRTTGNIFGRKALFFAVTAILGLHGVLLVVGAWIHTPTCNEVAQLPAGLSHLCLGQFDLYRVNPPLVRLVAALPVVVANPNTNWQRYGDDPLTRYELPVGIDFLYANDYRSFSAVHVSAVGVHSVQLTGGDCMFPLG